MSYIKRMIDDIIVMHQDGIDLEDIASIFGMNVDDVKALLNSLEED